MARMRDFFVGQELTSTLDGRPVAVVARDGVGTLQILDRGVCVWVTAVCATRCFR